MAKQKPTSPSRGRRFLVLLAFFAVAAGLVWWTGVLASWPRSQAENGIRANNLDEAEFHIRRAISLDPSSPESHLILARIQRKQGELEDFVETLKRAVSLGLDRRLSANEALLAQAQSGAFEAIQGQLDEMLISGTTDGREVLEAYVNGCLKSARLEQAQTLLDGWTNAFPEDAQSYYYSGRLFMHYGRNEDAQEQFHAALEREPRHYASAYLLGQILMEQNRPDEAVVRFRQCDTMKYNAAARIAQAQALRSLGKVDEARDILASVVALPEEDIKRGFQRLGDRYEGAPAQLELGGLEAAVGRHAEALPWLDAAIAANPRDLSARQARGIALRSVGRTEEANQELEAVRAARLALREVDRLADLIQKDAELVDERVRIGELYLTYESELTGEFWIKTALARDPRNQRAHELLATLYEKRARDNPGYRELARFHRRQADTLPKPESKKTDKKTLDE